MNKEWFINNISIVIARYNESLDWILEAPFSDFSGCYIVYNKGPNDNFVKDGVKTIINLPNVGRCDHTFLYHIVNSYDSISANITVFLPGSINIVCPKTNHQYKKDQAIKLLTAIMNNGRACFIADLRADKGLHHDLRDFSLEHWEASDPTNTINEKQDQEHNCLEEKSKLDLCRIRPYGRWYKYFFGDLNVHIGCYWGIFSIGKRDILNHPLEHYKKFLDIVSHSCNPEAGHYIERSWGAIFHPLVFTKIII